MAVPVQVEAVAVAEQEQPLTVVSVELVSRTPSTGLQLSTLEAAVAAEDLLVVQVEAELEKSSILVQHLTELPILVAELEHEH
jgi:hypothetical protein